MSFVRTYNFKGAAIHAALFVCQPYRLPALTSSTLAVIAALALSALPVEARMARDTLAIELKNGGAVSLDIELAVTDQDRSLGLMFRTELADNQGMLFHYGKPQDLTMWMRNTYIPLDMLFIKGDGTIHRIEVRAEPLSEKVIAAGAPVAAVLELAGGAAERLGIKPGDRVRHSAFGTDKAN